MRFFDKMQESKTNKKVSSSEKFTRQTAVDKRPARLLTNRPTLSENKKFFFFKCSDFCICCSNCYWKDPIPRSALSGQFITFFRCNKKVSVVSLDIHLHHSECIICNVKMINIGDIAHADDGNNQISDDFIYNLRAFAFRNIEFLQKLFHCETLQLNYT